MPIKYYVLPEEREQLQKDAVRRATKGIDGPVSLYEEWPGEKPLLNVTNEAMQAKRPFCKLVWEDEIRKEKCLEEHKKQSADTSQPEIRVCWCGVHNMVCPVKDEFGGKVTLTGGEFRVRERSAEAEAQLEQFLSNIPSAQQDKFRMAWRQLPEVSEEETLGYKMRELKLAGSSYLHDLKQRSDFRYFADLATHDLVIALQALIADIEVLKIEMKEAFGIGQKWEQRFESLIRTCEDYTVYLGAKLDLGRPKYEYISINKLLYECIDLYVLKAKERRIDFMVDLERGKDDIGKPKGVAVYMDRGALKQALQNILSNAIKYSFSGTADHPRRVEVIGQLQAMGGVPGYSITISNLGIGIERDELELVFEPGYQGRRRFEEHRSGYGMGLTFVKECIEKHGGNITIASEPRQRTGWLTTVFIWIPLHGPKK
jgi:signal transduction histidine kinase